MRLHLTIGLLCVSVFGAVAWFARNNADEAKPEDWTLVAPGVLRSPGLPASYALVDGHSALLIDAAASPLGVKRNGITTIEGVLLTHHHRDTAAFAGQYLADGIQVRTPKASAEWLTPENVRTFWKTMLPLRNSKTAYLVVPEGFKGIDCSLADGQTIIWREWNIRIVATPGHSRDHVAYAARKGREGPLLVFCGDSVAEPGKMWTPFTMDWHHSTDEGLAPAAESLRKLAALEPSLLLPAHGPVMAKDCAGALNRTADAVSEIGFLKSFRRYSKERLKDPPPYAFLAKEQSESNGSKPWTRISEHLWLTGNTYVLVSKDEGKPCLVVDSWDPHSARQLPKLKADQNLGPMEVSLCTHAHNDHYNGVYSLLQREKCQLWTLDRVAPPVADPFLLRHPFLDARPVKFDRLLKDGETVAWREYSLRFRFLPGQTVFTMGVETVIDGKRCFFTADNFFHMEQFGGNGGWMGLNSSWPLFYAESGQKVMDAAPEWVLAEHGGAFEYNAEDFRRRIAWAKLSATAADAVCPTGRHRFDWDPNRVHFERLLQQAKPGGTLTGTLVASNLSSRLQKLTVALEGRGLTPDQAWDLDVPAGETVRKAVTVKLIVAIPPGRHVFAFRVAEGDRIDGSDAFFAVDVAP